VSVKDMASTGGEPSAVLDELQARSSLHLGDRIVRPKLVRALDSGHGVIYLFQFARDGTFEDFTHSMDLQVQLGKTFLRASFEPKKMVFQGKSRL
jgi:hypothetical protein